MGLKEFFLGGLTKKSQAIISGTTTLKREAALFAKGVAISGAIGGTILGGAALGTARLGAAAASLIPKSTFGKIGLASGTLIAGGVALEDPRRLGRFAKALVTKPVELGRQIGKGEQPSVGTGLKKAGAVGAVAAILGGGAIVGSKLLKGRKKAPIMAAAEKPITPETQIVQTQPEVAPVTDSRGNGGVVNTITIKINAGNRKLKNTVYM